MALMYLAQAKDQLHVTSTESDNDILLKMDQASDIVLTHLKGRAGLTWTEETVPLRVQAAAMVMLEHLYHRSPESKAYEEMEWLLLPFREPTLR